MKFKSNLGLGGLKMSQIIRLPKVKSKVDFSRATIYRLIKLGLFPKPLNIGPRAVGWLESDIENWIAEQASQRHAQLSKKK